MNVGIKSYITEHFKHSFYYATQSLINPIIHVPLRMTTSSLTTKRKLTEGSNEQCLVSMEMFVRILKNVFQKIPHELIMLNVSRSNIKN